MINLAPERYMPASVRAHIEQTYYARVNEQSKLETLIGDPQFLEDAARNPVFFSDHGVVHVRDVAQQVLRVLQTINGVLIPRRTEPQMEAFLYGYGVVLAYLHDIGMHDLTRFGRAMHPEFAAQAVFGGSLDAVVATLWEDNCGNIAWRLTKLANAGILTRDPQIVFRELLAMSIGHSKSKVPVTVLDEPAALRVCLQTTIGHNLRVLYHQQQTAKGKPLPPDFAVEPGNPPYVVKYYSDFEREAFDWLTADAPEARRLASDVTDTLRALRCADALRQRGTVEKTSGGYEIYASQKSGNCVLALRLGGERLYLLELEDDPDGAGEANIASSEFNQAGDVRIAFHRGAFDSTDSQQRSAYSTAYVINDFLRDTVDSFWRAAPVPGVKQSKEIQIQLESTDDDPRFTDMVRDQLRQFNPAVGDQIQIVPSLRHVSESERARYLWARELDWEEPQRRAVLAHISAAGLKLTSFDAVESFRHVKQADLLVGEKLIEAGAPASFVYLPLGDGLRIIPLGGYQSFSVAAWMPLGTTGVIRGDIRNADIVAEQPVAVLIIPKEVYLRYWYTPYTPAELMRLLAPTAA